MKNTTLRRQLEAVRREAKFYRELLEDIARGSRRTLERRLAESGLLFFDTIKKPPVNMKIELSRKECNELARDHGTNGGFQSFLTQLHYRVDDDTGILHLDSLDLEKIHRYAFAYKNGGWQGRLKKIFSRSLGSDLSGVKP